MSSLCVCHWWQHCVLNFTFQSSSLKPNLVTLDSLFHNLCFLFWSKNLYEHYLMTYVHIGWIFKKSSSLKPVNYLKQNLSAVLFWWFSENFCFLCKADPKLNMAATSKTLTYDPKFEKRLICFLFWSCKTDLSHIVCACLLDGALKIVDVFHFDQKFKLDGPL